MASAPSIPIARFAYVSKAVPDLDDAGMLCIVQRSWANNSRRDIRGALSHQDGEFRQIIEGHPKDISSLVSRILTDQRHRAIEVLQFSLVEAYAFQSWSIYGFDSFFADQPPVPVEAILKENVISVVDFRQRAVNRDMLDAVIPARSNRGDDLRGG